MHFVLTGELDVHLSTLASPKGISDVSNILAAQGYVDLSTFRAIPNKSKQTSRQVKVLKEFNLVVRTGGILAPKSRSCKGWYKSKQVIYTRGEVHLWNLSSRYWSEIISRISSGKNVSLPTHYKESRYKSFEWLTASNLCQEIVLPSSQSPATCFATNIK